MTILGANPHIIGSALGLVRLAPFLIVVAGKIMLNRVAPSCICKRP